MRLLLDTQILLWGLEDLDKLASAELAAIASPDNTIYFSPVNVWEIAIKRGLGKLDVAPDFLTRVRAEPSLKALRSSWNMPGEFRNCPVCTAIHSIDC